MYNKDSLLKLFFFLLPLIVHKNFILFLKRFIEIIHFAYSDRHGLSTEYFWKVLYFFHDYWSNCTRTVLLVLSNFWTYLKVEHSVMYISQYLFFPCKLNKKSFTTYKMLLKFWTRFSQYYVLKVGVHNKGTCARKDWKVLSRHVASQQKLKLKI